MYLILRQLNASPSHQNGSFVQYGEQNENPIRKYRVFLLFT